jgi:hypothetical protein
MIPSSPAVDFNTARRVMECTPSTLFVRTYAEYCKVLGHLTKQEKREFCSLFSADVSCDRIAYDRIISVFPTVKNDLLTREQIQFFSTWKDRFEDIPVSKLIRGLYVLFTMNMTLEHLVRCLAFIDIEKEQFIALDYLAGLRKFETLTDNSLSAAVCDSRLFSTYFVLGSRQRELLREILDILAGTGIYSHVKECVVRFSEYVSQHFIDVKPNMKTSRVHFEPTLQSGRIRIGMRDDELVEAFAESLSGASEAPGAFVDALDEPLSGDPAGVSRNWLDRMFGFMHNVEDGAQGFNELMKVLCNVSKDQLKPLLETTTDTFQSTGNIARSVESVAGYLSGILSKDNAHSTVSMFGRYVAPLVCIATFRSVHKSAFIKAIFGISMVAFIWSWREIAFKMLKSLWAFVVPGSQPQESGTPLFQSEEAELPVFQSFEAAPVVLKEVLTFIKIIFNFRDLNAREEMSSVQALATALQPNYVTQQTVATLGDFAYLDVLVDRLMVLYNRIRGLIGSFNPGTITGFKDVDDVVTRVRSFTGQINVMPTSGNHATVTSLCDSMLRLQMKYKDNPAASRIIGSFLPKIEKIRDELTKLGAMRNQFRVDPTWINLWGKPGQGKSKACEVLNDWLCQYTLRDHPEKLAAYKSNPFPFRYRRIASEYWEGVTEDCILVTYPDREAAEEGPNAKINTSRELIDLVSNEPMPVNMAFELKGKMVIAPEWITSTTNLSRISQATVDQGAVARRMVAFEVELADTSADNNFRAAPGDPIRFDRWKFHLSDVTWAQDGRVADPALKRLNKPPMTIYEVFNYVCLKKAAEYEKFMSMKDRMNLEPDFDRLDALLSEDFSLGCDYFQLARKAPIPVLQTGVFPSDPTVTLTTPRLSKNPIWKSHEHLDFTMRRPIVVRQFREMDGTAVLRFREWLFETKKDFDWSSVSNSDRVYLVLKSIKEWKEAVAPVNTLTNTEVTSIYALIQSSVSPIVGYWKEILGVLSGVAAAIGMYKVFVGLKDRPEAEPGVYALPDEGVVVNESLSPQSSAYTELTAKKKAAARRRNFGRLKRVGEEPTEPVVKLQSAQIDTIESLMKRYNYSIINELDGTVIQRAVCLGERVFLVNKHFIHALKANLAESPGYELPMRMFNGAGVTFNVTSTQILGGVENEDYDLYVFRLPDTYPSGKDILPHWASENAIEESISNHKVITAGTWNTRIGRSTSHAKFMAGQSVRTPDGEQMFLKNTIKYMSDSEHGDCGQLIYGAHGDRRLVGKFMGIHAAGGQGFSESHGAIITPTTLKIMIAKIKGEEPPKLVDDDIKEQIFGVLEKGHHFYTQQKDVLVPTQYQAVVQSKAPCAVNKPEVYRNARRGYNNKFKVEPEHQALLELALDRVLEDFVVRAECAPDKGTYDLKCAIFGMDGTNFKGINLSTSAGAPFNIHGTTKAMLIGKYEDNLFVPGSQTQELIAEYESALLELYQGSIPFWFNTYTDIVKDELLKIAKVQEDKGRLVSAANVINVLVHRTLYGPFIKWIIDNHLTNGIALGDNWEGDDANLITRTCLSLTHGEEAASDGDYQAFDTRHAETSLRAGMRAINKFLAKHSLTGKAFKDKIAMDQRKTLENQFSCQVHLRGTIMDTWRTSLPSGHPLTSILNSLLNKAYILCALVLENGNDRDLLYTFPDFMITRVLGDDNEIVLRSDCKHYLNPGKVARAVALYGHVYTDAEKTGNLTALKKYEDCQFLKRTKRFEPLLGKYVAPLDLKSLLEIPLWTKAEGSDRVPSIPQAIENLESMLRGLCLHSQEIWDEYFPKYVKMYEEHDWTPKSDDRKFYLQQIFPGQLIYV